MKERLITYVKYFKWIYALYFYTYKFLLGIMKIFIRTDKKLNLINSFGGKKYHDSPKALY